MANGHTNDEVEPPISSVGEALLGGPPTHAPTEGGLRERKKAQTRQRISDTATMMFLDEGFEEVRVVDIARACDVSEKTVYNYFPTKESLVFDREEELSIRIRDAIGNPASNETLVDSVLHNIEEDLSATFDAWKVSDDPESVLTMIRRFVDLIEDSPELEAWMHAMNERLAQVAASALAERAGVDPTDPEPLMAATIVIGLYRVDFQSRARYSDSNLSLDEAREAIRNDVRRAAHVAATGLSSFELAMTRSTKPQVRPTDPAAQESRDQVIEAMIQARKEWQQLANQLRRERDAQTLTPEARKEWRRRIRQLRAEMMTDRRKRIQQLRRDSRRSSS